MAQNSNQSEKSSKSDQSLRKTPPPPLPFAHHLKDEPEKKEKDTGPMTVKEGLEIAKSLRKIHDDLDSKLDEVYQKTGWTPKQLKTLLSNSTNFTAKQWEDIQKKRETLMATLKMTDEAKQEAREDFLSNSSAKTSSKGRGKTAASRRNWIPVR